MNAPQINREPGCPAESVRAALETVLASRVFQTSDTLRRLLRYTVEQTLDGRADRLKEYSLAVDVLGRATSFDPRVDSVVRVEVSRLRSRLAEYYRADGAADPVRIELPRGSYIPRFGLAEPPAPSAPASRPRPGRAAAGVAAAGVLAAVWWVAAGPMRGSRAPDTQVPPASIAVLPFVNLDEKDAGYLGDGIAEEITNALARVPGFRVTARSSAFRFKGGSVDVREIGRQLRVAAVLEGSVRVAGDRLRITAQLIGAADGYHLWSETYDRSSSEILATQTSIAQAIAANLTPRLASQEGHTPFNRHTASAAAYDLVLKARYLDPIATSADDRIRWYRQALEHDPDYADAYIGLADEWRRQSVEGSALPREVMQKARDATAKALHLDDTLPSAHYESAMIRWMYDWDWAGADREFQRTLQLNPNSAPARVQYARYLALMGRREEALQQLEQLRALDPLSATLRGVEAAVFYLTGDYDRTIEHARAVLAGQPDLWLLKFWMGRAYDSKGQLSEAIATLEQWRSIPGTLQGSGFGILGCLYARAGRRAEAVQLVEAQIARSKRSHVSPSSVALVYIGLGDFNRAIEWLEKAYEERDHTLVALKIDPAYRPLRSDPRFIALLRRMRLE